MNTYLLSLLNVVCEMAPYLLLGFLVLAGSSTKQALLVLESAPDCYSFSSSSKMDSTGLPKYLAIFSTSTPEGM